MDNSPDFSCIQQSGAGIAGLTAGNAYNRFLSDLKDESLMNTGERYHFVEILRPQGCRLNRLIESLAYII